MGFLRWIRNFSKRYKNREFQSVVRREKQQKYLFREGETQLQTKRGGIFRGAKKSVRPFVNFFQETIHAGIEVGKNHMILTYVGSTMILLCIYIVFFSSYFQISPSKVIIHTMNDEVDINIAYRAVESIYGQNIFFFDEEHIAKNLKKYQENIQGINITRLYPNGIKIDIESSPLLFRSTMQGRENIYWGLTQNGVYIPVKKEKLEGLRTLNIYADISEDDILEYKTQILENSIKVIEEVITLFQNNWSDIKIGNVKYLEKENEFHLTVESGGKILFRLQDFSLKNDTQKDIYKNLKDQLSTFKAYGEKNRQILKEEFVYIDMRIPGKVFLCRTKDLCHLNLERVYPGIYE